MEALRQFFRAGNLISDDKVDLIASTFRPVVYSHRELIVRSGSLFKSLLFIESGSVRGYYLVDGEQITNNFYSAPTLIADYHSYRRAQPTKIHLQALTSVSGFTAELGAIEALSYGHHQISLFFMFVFATLYERNYDRQLSFIFESPGERWARFLKEYPEIVQCCPQKHIASFIGVRPQSLSRIKSKR